MFHSARSHGRVLSSSLRPSASLNSTNSLRQCQRRWKSWFDGKKPPVLKEDMLTATTPVAKQLKDMGIWERNNSKRDRRKSASGKEKQDKPTGDKSRVNIVDEDLINDIISYIKPSLERHKGCDLISVYPGVGLFTRALHDAVDPRSHLLLEPDAALYEPFLEPILKHPGAQLIPKSGIVWDDLDEILSPKYLPNQVPIKRDLSCDPPRNDTLLVSMNLAMFPKKKYVLFDSISRMVVYQFVQTMRLSTLFQKYGLVRILVWLPNDEKRQLIPSILQQRKKLAIGSELTTEYIGEICGLDTGINEDDEEGKAVAGNYDSVRPHQVDLESMRQTLIRMRDGGFVTPKGRETILLKQFKALDLPLDTPVPLTGEKATYLKLYQKEIQYLEELNEIEPFSRGSENHDRLKRLRVYDRWNSRSADKVLEFTHNYDEAYEAFRKAYEARAKGTSKALFKAAHKLGDRYNKLVRDEPRYMRYQTGLMRDQLHIVRQPPELGPVLSWDRRPYEPLPVKATDFFPNAPCTLLDIQPKAPHPLLRAMGPGTDNAGDIFDMILGALLQNCSESIPTQMELVWPGTSEGIMPHCPSLTDPAKGGSPLTGFGALGARAINEMQLLELVEQFVKWPFRPSYAELVGRLTEDKYIDDTMLMADEDGPGMGIMGNNTMDSF